MAWAALAACCVAGSAFADDDPLATADAAARTQTVAMLRADAERNERGDGVQRDASFAAALYCQAARLGDAESQFRLGWIYAQGRGVERNDAWAAHLFEAAAAQGIPQAPNVLRLLGHPASEKPPCLRDPDPPPVAQADAEPALPPPEPVTGPKPIVDLVRKLAPKYSVQPELALAIIKAESNFDAAALSPKRAMGLMQLVPETAQRFRVRNPFDPRQNIAGGLAYLRWLLAYFEGNLALVAAAYNAGEGTVEKYLGVPPYGETQAYVRHVLAAVGRRAHPFEANVTAPSPLLPSMRSSER